jgi:arabinogalactan oligomer/maltooligosaccharide transport system permease protein
VPWHPGVFYLGLDGWIFALGLLGLPLLWLRSRPYVVWALVSLAVILLWPTKWPQYILVLTAPLSLAAGEGFKASLIEPVKAFISGRRQKREKTKLSLRQALLPAPWLLPGLITLAVLIAFPLVYQLAMSLTDFSALSIKDGINGGIWREVWLGLTSQVKPIIQSTASTLVHYQGFNLFNYIFSAIPQVLVFELIWTVGSVGLQGVLGIGIALLLNQKGIRFRNLWRTIFLLPWAIPEFVGALIWLRTFDPTAGWVPQAFGTSGGSGGVVLISRLLEAGGQNLTMLFMLVAGTWIGFPLVMLAASASLKLIPEDVYDAAAIDGAARWSLFRHVTWPLLLPLVVPALIIRGILSFNQFYLFYAFFPSGRGNPFGTFSYYSYIIFKEQGGYAVSAAINIVTVVILIILIMLFNRWSKASEGVTYA